MKIVVCIKQVPDTSDIKWTEDNTIKREGVESVLNPMDYYAIETALRIKDKEQESNNTCEVIAVSMGPMQAKECLKKAIAMGCDKAYLLSDKNFAGSDTYATSKILSTFIKKKIKDYELVLCGQYASDGDTAQTGPSMARQLQMPVITGVTKVQKDNNFLMITLETENYTEEYVAPLRTLLCISKCDFEPRRPSIDGFIKTKNTEIEVISGEDIGLNAENTGIKGSPTYVSKAFSPKIEHCGEIYIAENLQDTIETLKSRIRDYV